MSEGLAQGPQAYTVTASGEAQTRALCITG